MLRGISFALCFDCCDICIVWGWLVVGSFLWLRWCSGFAVWLMAGFLVWWLWADLVVLRCWLI